MAANPTQHERCASTRKHLTECDGRGERYHLALMLIIAVGLYRKSKCAQHIYRITPSILTVSLVLRFTIHIVQYNSIPT
eukprot:scaffold996_cov190-Alexandrium_tamarense.AAC.33